MGNEEEEATYNVRGEGRTGRATQKRTYHTQLCSEKRATEYISRALQLRRLLKREVQLRKRLDGECAERRSELASSSATVESVLFL